MWHSGTNSNVGLFALTCPAGTTIDIEIEGILAGGPGGQTTSGLVAVVRSIVGATAGLIYWSTMGNLFPIESTTI